MNLIMLKGTVISDSVPVKLKDFDGNFYKSILQVPRKSGANDELPFVSEKEFKKGEHVAFKGKMISEFRYDKNEDRHHLMMEAKAEEFLPYDDLEDGFNVAVIEGVIKKKEHLRFTPFGKTIIDFSFATKDGNRTNGIFPSIAWGNTAETVDILDENDDEYKIRARFQSREYQKQEDAGTVTKTAYELSVYQFGEASS